MQSCHSQRTQINLSRRSIGPSDVPLLQQAIRSNPHLSVLKLGYNALGDQGVATLVTALHSSRLHTLDLGFNGMGDAGCEAIAVHAVAGNLALRTLYLAGNGIGEKGTLAIAGAILHGSGLENLSMAVNNCGSLGVRGLAGAMAKVDDRVRKEPNGSVRAIRHLSLGSVNLCAEGVVAVSSMLLSNSSLVSLDLSDSKIDDQQLGLLAQAFTQNKAVPLRTLDLSFNEITCAGVENLANAVWGSQTLRSLRLDNNYLRDRGVQLCAVLLTSIALEELDIGFNRKVTSVGVKALMKNVSESKTMASIGLCGIEIDLNSAKALSFALAYNSTLTAIYLDNCNIGYSAQRHIVAGIVSNRRLALRVFSGFPLTRTWTPVFAGIAALSTHAFVAIASTLGMPRLPQKWSNDQLLGFLRHMWEQWLFKMNRGVTNVETPAGPAPPSAVASAAKITFASLGSDAENLFVTEDHAKPLAERPPLDPVHNSFIERTGSGTLRIPDFCDKADDALRDWCDVLAKDSAVTRSSRASAVASLQISPVDDPVRRNKNLEWLRSNYHSLSDIGRLPFNSADLWQLHQYFFSPPASPHGDQGSVVSLDGGEEAPPLLGRTVSFQALCAAEAANVHKRRQEDDLLDDEEPAPKRVKNLKPRLEFYPRIMEKVQAIGSGPNEQVLSILRQLKYTERVMFNGEDPYYCESQPTGPFTREDVEMVLLDLL